MVNSKMEELKNWIHSLTAGEFRYIRQLGTARARGQNSQVLDLMDWLRNAKAGEEMPDNAPFSKNFSTMAFRLRDLVLDGLRTLHKRTQVDLMLHAELDAASLLDEKGLRTAAMNKLARVRRIAVNHSRYAIALSSLALEQRILMAQPQGNEVAILARLRAEEEELLTRHGILRRLQAVYDRMFLRLKQMYIPRDPEILEEFAALWDRDLILTATQSPQYTERALGIVIVGIRNLMDRDKDSAINHLRKMLIEWSAQPSWQQDQPLLLLRACNLYQNACLTSHLGWKELEEALSVIPDFQGVDPKVSAPFQVQLHLQRLVLAINLGQLDAAIGMIPGIDAWIADHSKLLNDGQMAVLRYNFAVASFFAERYDRSYHHVMQLIQLPKSSLRTDLREFASIFQVILLYELGEDRLNEYLLRAQKRRYEKRDVSRVFESMVVRCLDRIQLKGKDIPSEMAKLRESLDSLVDDHGNTLNVAGLMEVRIWAEARQKGSSLREVFLQIVADNLRT